MLWLCILLPRFGLEGPANDARGPGSRRRGARAAQAALETLALWALQWSSQVSCRAASDDNGADDCADDGAIAAERTAALWLEIGASRQLFGSHAALLARIAAGLAPLGYTSRLGTAPTPQGAALLARAGITDIVLTPAQLQQRLEPLPLALLALPQAHITALESAGLRHIGELLALPATSLARRFGPAINLYLDRLRGSVAEPLPLVRVPARFDSRCDFNGAITDTTALLFPLRRLLAGLQGYLRGLDRAVQRYTLCLEHHRRPATRLTIGLARPGRDVMQLLTLARERLASTVLAAPVLGLGIEAHELLQPLVLQSDLFSREAQQTEQLQHVIDRFAARLGMSAVQILHGTADHRPEYAWQMSAARLAASSAPRDASWVPARPCWLLPEPQPIDQPQQLLAGPERIESGWWDGADIARDYYLARGTNGAQLWVFHDLRRGGWHLHGIWA